MRGRRERRRGPDGARGGPPGCSLCGAPEIARVGAWVASPETEARLQLPPDHGLVAVWAVCRACDRAPDVASRVEAAILAEAEGLRAATDPRRN